MPRGVAIIALHCILFVYFFEGANSCAMEGYRCNECFRTIKRKDNFRRHLREVHHLDLENHDKNKSSATKQNHQHLFRDVQQKLNGTAQHEKDSCRPLKRKLSGEPELKSADKITKKVVHSLSHHGQQKLGQQSASTVQGPPIDKRHTGIIMEKPRNHELNAAGPSSAGGGGEHTLSESFPSYSPEVGHDSAPTKAPDKTKEMEDINGTHASKDRDPIFNDLEAKTKQHKDQIGEILERYHEWIKTKFVKTNRMQNRYNFQLETASNEEFEKCLETVMSNEGTHRFKLNLSLGFVLVNHLTGQLVYYYASTNNRMFESPIVINSAHDVSKIRSEIGKRDLLEYCRTQRPNTKFGVLMVTNALFYVNRMKQFRMGCFIQVPDHVRNCQSLIAFVNDSHGVAFKDNLCFYRSLAFHRNKSHIEITTRALELAKAYLQRPDLRLCDVAGVSLEELQQLEDKFQVNIEVFSLKQITPIEKNFKITDSELHRDGAGGEGQSDAAAVKVWSSRRKYPGPDMNLNLYKRHFSYITNLSTYTKCWMCRKCEKLFPHAGHMKVHERNCNVHTTVVFPGGGYGPTKSIFEKLTEHGISVDTEDLKFYPYRISFDFECYFVSCKGQLREESRDGEASTTNTEIMNKLEPGSVSVCSNVPGYEKPRCFVSGEDPVALVGQMYDYIVEINMRAQELLRPRYCTILNELNHYVDERNYLIETAEDAKENKNYSEYRELIDEAHKYYAYEGLLEELEKWISRIVALGFNTSKFDFNLIRQYLFPHFLAEEVEVDYIIKRGNDYMSISTDDVLFLDVKNYLAAGISYKKWLESNHIKQGKGIFPYEWFTDLKKLDETQLPPIEAFWSTMKQANVTEEEYAEMQRVWNQEGFTSMRDMLIWYNNLDVGPFLEAAEVLYQYWKGLGIDPFKENAISLPGLALKYLTKTMTPHTVLPLFPERHCHLYRMLRENIVGGLAVVGHRYHERGVTKLPNGSVVAWIFSHDCNGLYLWGLGQPTGTGIYSVWTSAQNHAQIPTWRMLERCGSNEQRQEEEKKWEAAQSHNMDLMFTRETSYTYHMSELCWLEWYSFKNNKHVEHKFNGRGKNIRFGKNTVYPVDGFIPEDQTVLQFQGCKWHGHGCELDNSKIDERLINRQRTETVVTNIESLGFNVVQKWECEWQKDKRGDPAINKFISDHLSLLCKSNCLSGKEIVENIRNGSLFGMVECDIEVPRNDGYLIKFFEEFPPICKNTNISIDDIGDHMRSYAEENGYMRKPRRNLINSYWGQKILLTTPIVQWYLKNGLVVTRIYQVIEMKPKKCFTSIVEEITQKRRAADNDPALAPEGQNWKTMGNSLYGKTITNKEKHKDCKIVPDALVGKYVNDCRFHKAEEIGEVAYEVSMSKKKIKQDLPITVAFFVYNYAKLRQLEFVYDFLKRYLKPGSFQMVCSDTDSIVAAYQSRNIDDLVKRELWEEYSKCGKKQFLATDSHSLRTPGLYKVELDATGVIALCAKTYHAWNDEDGSTKTSSKGLSKQTNKLSKHDFFNVLLNRVAGRGTNYGFNVLGDALYQVKQSRAALSYLYVKRMVMADGVSTRALHL